jgi:hypothetical protein
MLLVSGVGPNQEFEMTRVLHRNTINEALEGHILPEIEGHPLTKLPDCKT